MATQRRRLLANNLHISNHAWIVVDTIDSSDNKVNSFAFRRQSEN